MIICLKQRRIYQYSVKECIPGDGETQTPTVEAKVVDANVEACGIITNFMDSRKFAALFKSEEITQNGYQLWKKVNKTFASSSFNSKARILSKFQRLTYEDNLKEFIANMRNCLSDIASIIHYCSNGKHNPLVTTHSPEKCWQLHPELNPNRQQRDKEQKTNFIIAKALFGHDSRQTNQTLAIVLDIGAFNYMFNDKCCFENLHQDHRTNMDTGCNKSALTSQGRGLAKIYDQIGNLWLLPNRLYFLDLTANLLAPSTIAKTETQIKRTFLRCEISLDNNIKPSFVCPTSSNVLETQISIHTSHCLNTQVKDNGDLWHKQLGHMKKVINTSKDSNV
ncbi:hypothetical protein O181_031145 [Austropuccinia psidii MF-1]|uniref:Uncharacterized protein n=1 Tax=Austropuccinia psidii MF-1 TaxID=1389203 RepID=A0A9Q3CXF3_9BASI|nr:hypothetical protein [Austropuccinia psidii MF-1]